MSLKMKDFLEWIYCGIIAITIVMLFKYYIGVPTTVKQISMYPTLVQDQKLWLNRWERTTKKMPERGDIITFEAPSIKRYNQSEIDNNNPVAKYEKKINGIVFKLVYYVFEWGKESYIKRVIALPGEHVEIKEGYVYINGNKLEEEYLQSGIITESKGFNDFVVPENYVFAMGDNRNHSTDCREFGCIPLEKIEGVVSIRIWPLNVFGKVD